MTFDLQTELKIVSNPNSIKKEKNKTIYIHMWHDLHVLAERLWVYSNVSQWYMVLWNNSIKSHIHMGGDLPTERSWVVKYHHHNGIIKENKLHIHMWCD